MGKRTYFDNIHRWGRISCVLTIIVMLAIPLAMTLRFDVRLPVMGILRSLATVLPMFWIVAAIETISYAPILGSGGSYLSFVTGNIANLRLPCAIAAMKNADVRASSEQGEVISTIAVAASAITTTIILAACVLLLMPVLPVLMAEESALAPAFQQILPALFGALLAGYLWKYWRLVFAPIVAGVAVLLIAPTLQVGVLIPITVVVSLGSALLYGKLKERKQANL